ncbi:MAG: ABC transporter permease [Planctomycetaceae bacterium]
MLAGPIFSREALTAPRQLRHYLIRSGYVAVLFVLMYTAAQATFGWQEVRNLGDLARFGSLVFQVFSLVQLALVLFFALLFTAGSIAQEKDRRTLILLLMTDLRDRELVLGKLAASSLIVAVLLATSLPVFALVHMLGGVSREQLVWSLAISAATAMAAASWGALAAFWREKTFQTLAVGVLGVVGFLGVVELAVGVTGTAWPAAARVAAAFDPFRGMLSILDPLSGHPETGPMRVSAWGTVLAMLGLSAALGLATVLRLRVWNPPRAVYEGTRPAEATRAQARAVWHNPVVWREIRTRAYGRKIVVIKLAYLALAGALLAWLARAGSSGDQIVGVISPTGFAFVALALLSLLLINAQSVTALTSERDAGTLELLLVTDVTAREFIFGKVGGVLYNTKELIAVPLALAGWALSRGDLSGENFVCLLLGFAVLAGFATMLGLHAGLSYESSRSAIANSLGTMFFLFIGIFIFMILLVETSGSFALQIQSFLVFIVVGSIALQASLTRKNPSTALTLAAWLAPFLTFYAITSYLLGEPLATLLAVCAAYGFATVAMTIPAVSDFDVALGRTTADKG